MQIGILHETAGERRVSLLPEHLKLLPKHKFVVEQGAGDGAFQTDAAYQDVGATVASRSEALNSEIVLTIGHPIASDVPFLLKGRVVIGLFLNNPLNEVSLHSTDATFLNLSQVPRITRAQSMDVLSSMASIAGYKAVILAAAYLPKYFPMLSTAAGTIPPAKVLVIGAGVAGLQAIATAKRLGAVVSAFDTRPSVKEQVQSLGGKFIEVSGSNEDASAGGYAVEQSEDYKRQQAELIATQATLADVIITTAQIPGKNAPILIPISTLDAMKPGSVIVDLAASSGGNCELTNPLQPTLYNGITIIGESNLPSTLPQNASKLYGKNLVNFLKLLIPEQSSTLNLEDEIIQATVMF